MIMEPVSDASTTVLAQTERGKFTNEITKLTGKKRKRESGADEASDADEGEGDDDREAEKADAREGRKTKRNYGPKGPNPLSIKKKKKAALAGDGSNAKAATDRQAAPKKKRIRKSRTKPQGDEAATVGGDVSVFATVATEA